MTSPFLLPSDNINQTPPKGCLKSPLRSFFYKRRRTLIRSGTLRHREEMSEFPEYLGKHYAEGRPTYPEELFRFIACKTPSHDLAWDAGTGTGQAAKSLAKIYKNVIATDISQEQLDFAAKLPNIRYQCNPPKMSITELEQIVGAESSVDLVTSAEAMHWFDLPNFYQNVKWVLKKPNGVIAAWCYSLPVISPPVDSLIQRLYHNRICRYFKPQSKLVLEGKYKTIDFPFEPVDGLEHNGPFEFKMEKLMDLDALFSLIKSWSAYKAAKEDGVELLTEDVVEEFKSAWNEDGKPQKLVTYPIYLRIGKVGN